MLLKTAVRECSRMTPERALSLGGKGRRTRSAWIGSARSSLDVFMSMTRCLHCGRRVEIPDDAFMVKRLPGYSPDLAGRIVYPAAFDALGY